MNHSSEEQELRERFQELKRAEERSTPAFGRLWQSAAARRSAFSFIPLRIRIALLAIVAAGVFIVLNVNGRRGQETLSNWRSPTEFLLKVPGEQFLRTLPQLGNANQLYSIPSPKEQS